MEKANPDSVGVGDDYFRDEHGDTHQPFKQLNLHKVIKNSYKNKPEALKKFGYDYDKDLSNDNEQVYFNKQNKKLLYSVAGTHNLKDVGTDLYLAAGGLKNTNRYKEADNKLKDAKKKYGVSNAVVVGHSLGSSIGQNIVSKGAGDKFYGLDAGYTIGQKTRANNGNSHHYRVQGDAVSLLGANAKNITTLKNPTAYQNTKEGYKKYGILGAGVGLVKDVLGAHDVDKIKHKKIFI